MIQLPDPLAPEKRDENPGPICQPGVGSPFLFLGQHMYESKPDTRHLPVAVTVLGNQGDSFQGRLSDCFRHGVKLILDRKLSAGSLLKVQWGRGMLLGEVISSWLENREFPAEVEVSEILDDIDAFNLASGS